MPLPERDFLDWTAATAPAAARWLQARASGALAIVPTQEAGRKLRRAMEDAALGAVVTPAQFLQPEGDDLAGPLAAALSLAQELSGPRAARCLALFPAGVPVRSFPERLALARNMRALQAELAEHGLTIGAAADLLAAGSPDAARWNDLDRLISAADDALLRSGLRDRESARLAAARNPTLPRGIKNVVVVAVADLQPIVAQALERLEVPVTILIAGPRDPASFDPWGRPLAASWITRDPGWSDFDAQVQLVAQPDNIALRFESTAKLEIGLLDRELLSSIKESLSASGRAVHDPTGLPVSGHWLMRTLDAFVSLVFESSFPAAIDLLRNGAVRAWLKSRVTAVDLESALTIADNIRAKHFPATLRAAQPWIRGSTPLHAAFKPIEAVLGDLHSEPLETVQKLALEFAEAFESQLAAKELSLLTSAREALAAALEQVRHAPDGKSLSASDRLHALRDAVASMRIYPPRETNAVEASGWLELPWSDASHVVLAGMNLGRVPAAPGSELFLGKSVRAALGLPGEEDRLARDMYFLARILARNRRVEVLVCQTDAEGSPIEPSPLLFVGAGKSLPTRVEKLFADPGTANPDPAWTAGWMLDPPVVEMPRVIAVTDFQRYLDCPFTFYLSRVAKMESFEPAADELDAAQFGDLIHTALQQWALDESLCDSTDPAAISRALDEHVADWVLQNLGRRLSLPLRLQVDSASARLAAFAEWQAADRREGWRIRSIEQSFAQILGRPWELDGWTISGRVDRLDENERDGRWRVIDYKTFDSADGPARKHLRAYRTANRTWPPGYARAGDSADWWTNLQLPLYRQLLIESGRDSALTSCGYFNLPKTVAETGLQTWDSLDDALQESAMTCARGVLADLGRRRFWPPNPRAAYADFAGFFPPDAPRIVDPNGTFVRSCAA